MGSVVSLALNNVTGDVAFSDSGSKTVKRIQYSTGMLWHDAGKSSGAAGDGGPGWNSVLTAAVYGLAYDTTEWAQSTTKGDHLLLMGQSTTSNNPGANMVLRGLSVSPGSGRPGVIEKMAGSYATGGLADGPAQDAATFGGIHGIATSKSNGTIYVLDRGSNAVRALTRAGQVFTVAGNGVPGYGGDGMPASASVATFKTPTDLAIDDETDTIFVADNGQSLIRMIDGRTRVVTTIAGILNRASSSTNAVDGGDPLQSPVSPNRLWHDATRKLLLFSDTGAKSIRGITCLRRTPPGKFYNIAADSFDDCPAGTYCPEDLGAMGGWGAFAVQPLACPAGAECSIGASEPLVPSPTASSSASPSPAPSEDASFASASPSPSPSPSPSLSPTSMPTQPWSSEAASSAFLGCSENNTALFTVYGAQAGSIVTAQSPADARFTGLVLDFKKRRLVFAEYAATSKYSLLKAVNDDGSVSILAGSTTKYAYGGDGSPATDSAVSMTSVQGICVEDATGDIYFADQASHRVRKLSGGERSGMMSRVAGNGGTSTSGGTKDGGSPLLAPVPNPGGLHCETNSTGFITRIYVTQGGGGRTIRVIDLVAGTISTLAGSGPDGGFAQGAFVNGSLFSGPQGISPYFASRDPASRPIARGFVVADSDSHSVRWLDTVNESVHLLAGNNSFGLNGDGGPATAARLNKPRDVVSDANTGSLYIADAGNNAIRMIDWRGTMRTVAGVLTAPSNQSHALVSAVGAPALMGGPVSPSRLFYDAPRRLLLFTDFVIGGVRGIACLPDRANIPAGKRFDLLSNGLEPCPKGFLCPAGSGVITIFNGSVGASSLAPCPGNGTFCPAGSSAPHDCPVGKYCPGPRFGDAFDCPQGFHCPGKTEEPIPCSASVGCLPLDPSSSPTPSHSPSVSPTASWSTGAIPSVTATETRTRTSTRTATHSRGASASITGSRSLTPTRTITRTSSETASIGATHTATKTAARSVSSTISGTPAPSVSSSPLATAVATASQTASASATYLPPPPAVLEAVIVVPGLASEDAQLPSVRQIIVEFFGCAAAAAAWRSATLLSLPSPPLVTVNVSLPVLAPDGSSVVIGTSYNFTTSAMCMEALGSDTPADTAEARLLLRRRRGRALQGPQRPAASFGALFEISALPPDQTGQVRAGVRTRTALALFDALNFLASGDPSAGGDQAMADAFALAVNNLLNDPYLQLQSSSDLALLERGFVVASLSQPVIPPLPARVDVGTGGAAESPSADRSSLASVELESGTVRGMFVVAGLFCSFAAVLLVLVGYLYVKRKQNARELAVAPEPPTKALAQLPPSPLSSQDTGSEVEDISRRSSVVSVSSLSTFVDDGSVAATRATDASTRGSRSVVSSITRASSNSSPGDLDARVCTEAAIDDDDCGADTTSGVVIDPIPRIPDNLTAAEYMRWFRENCPTLEAPSFTTGTTECSEASSDAETGTDESSDSHENIGDDAFAKTNIPAARYRY